MLRFMASLSDISFNRKERAYARQLLDALYKLIFNIKKAKEGKAEDLERVNKSFDRYIKVSSESAKPVKP